MNREPRLYVKRIWIERDHCTLSTLCEGEAPDLIEAHATENVVAVKEAALRRTPDELKRLLEAGTICPVAAFRLVLADGTTHWLDEPWILAAIERGDYEWCREGEVST